MNSSISRPGRRSSPAYLRCIFPALFLGLTGLASAAGEVAVFVSTDPAAATDPATTLRPELSYYFGEGSTAAGTTSATREYITLQNTTASALTRRKVWLDGESPDDFQIVQESGSPNGTMAAGEIQRFAVTFSPRRTGAKKAVVRIAGSGGISDTVQLSGLSYGPRLTVSSGGAELPVLRMLSFAPADGLEPVPVIFPGIRQIGTGNAGYTVLQENGTALTVRSELSISEEANVNSVASAYSTYTGIRRDGSVVNYLSLDAISTLPLKSLSAGNGFFLGLTPDGRIVSAGNDRQGQLGLPTTSGSYKAIAAGGQHSLAILSTGIMVSAGSNASKQTAIPSAVLRSSVAIAAGQAHSMALNTRGQIICWGDNSKGQSSPPADLIGVTAISAGAYRSLALMPDGTLRGWGENSGIAPHTVGIRQIPAFWGQSLAMGDPEIDFGPLPPSPADPVVKTITLGNTGERPLQLGPATLTVGDTADFSVDFSALPNTLNPGQTARISVAFAPTGRDRRAATLEIHTNDPANPTRTVTLSGTGTAPLLKVYSALSNSPVYEVSRSGPTLPLERDSGYPATITRYFTLQNAGAAPLGNFSFTFTGEDTTGFQIVPPAATTLAPGQSTTVKVVYQYQLGLTRQATLNIFSNEGEAAFSIPLLAPGLSPKLGIDAGLLSPYVGGTVLEVSPYGDASTQVTPNLRGVVSLADGAGFTVAALADGTVRVWGDDLGGSLQPPAGLAGVVKVVAGDRHIVALRANGTITGWGPDTAALPPDGTSGVKLLAAGTGSTVIITTGNVAKGWGAYNSNGVLPFILDVRDLKISGARTLALLSDGTVLQWGAYGLSYPQPDPSSLFGVTAIAIGDKFSFAMRANGSLACWGGAAIPFEIRDKPFVAIAARGPRVIAIAADGSILTWLALDVSSLTRLGFTLPTDLLPAEAIRTLTLGDSHVAVLLDAPLPLGTTPPGAALNSFILFDSVGDLPLSLSVASFTGDTADFQISLYNLPTTLNPYGHVILPVVFSPRAGGTSERRAVLSIATNDPERPLVSLVFTGTVISNYEVWRSSNFGTTANTGISADDADPNHNGIPNVLEYALGGYPLAVYLNGAPAFPTLKLDPSAGPGVSVATIPHPEGRTNVRLSLQAADEVEGPWHTLAISVDSAPFRIAADGVAITESGSGAARLATITETRAVPKARHFLRLAAETP